MPNIAIKTNPTITEAEYRKYPAMNYSNLANFYQSPDHALMPTEPKSYFEHGKIFESLLCDTATGSDIFSKRYFFSRLSGILPDDLIQPIEQGEDLEQYVRYNKDKITRSGTHKKRHAFIDECMANPGLIPVSTTETEMLKRMTENMLKMKYQGTLIRDILSNALFQVPVIWESNGMRKKALFDVVLHLDEETTLIGDIKSTADMSRVHSQLSQRLWIQDRHYTEGANVTWGCKVSHMPFLVSSKQKPYLSQIHTIDLEQVEDLDGAYEKVCSDFHAWNGMPKGWLPERSHRIFLRQ